MLRMLRLQITVTGAEGVVFENCAPFLNCTSQVNNTEIHNVKDIEIARPMYNLIECNY